MNSSNQEEPFPALFQTDMPDKLPDDLLALAHLSDVEEEAQTGPIRKTRTKVSTKSVPYGKKRKSEDDLWKDDMKELDFKTRSWRPFSTVRNAKSTHHSKSDI